MMRDPETIAEWQEAVNAAALGLLIESVKLYGLITGPDYNVERCEEILSRGAARGIKPLSHSELLKGLVA